MNKLLIALGVIAVLLLEAGGWYFLSITRSDKQNNCGDGICDSIERSDGLCSQDCDGAPVQATDNSKNTVSINADNNNNIEVTKSLVPRSADLNVKKGTGGGVGGTVLKSAPVNAGNVVALAPTATISANPISFAPGGSSVISWSCSNSTSGAVKYTNVPGGGYWYGISGSRSTGALSYSDTYIVNCVGDGGGISKGITVGPSVTAPIAVGFIADQEYAPPGQYDLKWNFTGPITSEAYCLLSDNPTKQGIVGSYRTPKLTTVTTYGVTCYDGPYIETQSITVGP